MMLLVTYGAWVFFFTQCWQGEKYFFSFSVYLKFQHAAGIHAFIKIVRYYLIGLNAE